MAKPKNNTQSENTVEQKVFSETHKLNPQQKMCCELYMAGKDILTSAKEAGYSDKCGDGILKYRTKQFLQSDKAIAYMKELKEIVSIDADISEDQILGGLKEMFLDKKLAPANRLKAAELLGKAKNMFVDTHVISDVDKHAELADKAWEYRMSLINKKKENEGHDKGQTAMDEGESNLVPIVAAG